jgi:hypothetical protein
MQSMQSITFDPQVARLLHRHGDYDWSEMKERRDLTAADLDPERRWATQDKVYECECGATFRLAPEGDQGKPIELPAHMPQPSEGGA